MALPQDPRSTDRWTVCRTGESNALAEVRALLKSADWAKFISDKDPTKYENVHEASDSDDDDGEQGGSSCNRFVLLAVLAAAAAAYAGWTPEMLTGR